MLDRADIRPCRWRAAAPAPLPVAEFVRGRPVAEVAALLPRLFNLCRAAQEAAVRLALGLPWDGEKALAAEIAREHHVRLCVLLPVALGQAPVAGIGEAEWTDGAAFDAYLASGRGLAPVLAAVRNRFGPGEACCGRLPIATGDTALTDAALENSVAARHLDHPVMRHIEAGFGRGPLWRVTARALDHAAARDGRLPAPRLTADGTALVPAARGLYAVRARVAAGRVTALDRVTPTDHMLATGGIVDQSLASLPPAQEDRARLLVDLLDPCVPLRLEEAKHA